jgi:hypothetical protein
MKDALAARNWLLAQGFEYWAEDDALHCPDNPVGSMIPYELLRTHGWEIITTIEAARGGLIRSLQATRPEWEQRESKDADCKCKKLTNV